MTIFQRVTGEIVLSGMMSEYVHTIFSISFYNLINHVLKLNFHLI